MPKLTLYHAAPSRSSIVHWMLEELGEPYDIHLISFKKGENLKPEFLAVNPMGKLPTIKHGDAVITEAAAICTYLADEFPQAKLNVPDRQSPARRLPQVAVLRAELRGAGGLGARLPAQGTGAAQRGRLRRFRHGHERAGQGRRRGGPRI